MAHFAPLNDLKDLRPRCKTPHFALRNGPLCFCWVFRPVAKQNQGPRNQLLASALARPTLRCSATREWRRKRLESHKTDSEMASPARRRGKVISGNTPLRAAFFRMSCSARSLAFSLRSRSISSRSGFSWPWPGKAYIKLLRPAPQHVLMDLQIPSRLGYTDPAVPDQSDRLNLELPRKYAPSHGPPPAPANTFSGCPRNRQQAIENNGAARED